MSEQLTVYDYMLCLLLARNVIMALCCTWNQVIRGGRRTEVSIFDIAVGDIIPLKIGDQVGCNRLSSSLSSLTEVSDNMHTTLGY